MTAEAYQFDALDRQIVALLKQDGRITNQEIGVQVGATRAMVGARVQRMTECGALRIVAAADFSAYDYNLLIALGIKVTGRSAHDVAAELARLPEMFAVHTVTGAHQIEALVAVHEFGELAKTVMPALLKIEGLGEIDVAIATDIMTYNFDVGISR
ncbi:Lrp/AsnC family transcriptional regulator [Sphingomonas jatrophae]|uniref:Lrp/AsnC family transcriptional regulator, regulator for asnA, asnC and gidA n=1 Tax=Sphingomonas jatrophae TaxID=1166337 RepID=A0A1I6KCH8_9SPHN|nr:Lrp/AsnC family transcriptional regulator [Sphingomonas jatrophae]SFR88580.1 Lrp/AsnC family transcriptional regulator, regulator for asnA, asnC and gidA [Sphingomonas jatrophae]